MPHGAGASAGGGSGGGGSYDAPQASKDTVRKQEAQSDATIDPVEDQEVAKEEKDVLHALAVSLGTEPQSPGMPPYESASQSLAELRAARFKLRIEPVLNSNGAAIGGGSFVQLKDSFSERVQALQGKLASGTASPAERAEVMKGSKQIMKLTGLRQQVTTLSMATLATNTHVQNGGLTMMLKIAGMVSIRKKMNMDFSDDDYARVKHIITRQKHWEALAASTMGMMAAYEAIIGTTTADPKALDTIANATIKAFPLDPQVSDDDVKNYVSHLSDNVAAQKSKYETMVRQAVGDAAYDAQYKAGIDRMFAQAAGASSTTSVTQDVANTNSKYQADLAKCARGEPLNPGSLVGPAKCQAARAQAQSGGGGDDSSGGGEAAEPAAVPAEACCPATCRTASTRSRRALPPRRPSRTATLPAPSRARPTCSPATARSSRPCKASPPSPRATTRAHSSRRSASRASSPAEASSRKASVSRASSSASLAER